MKAIILISLMIIVSCSPQRRLNRLIDKHPSLVQNDTVFIKDTIITKEVKSDTAFFYLVDSIIVTNEKLEIKYIKKNDTIYLSGKCKSDTIYYTNEVLVEKVVYKEVKKKVSIWNRIELILALLVLMIITLFGIRILKV